MSDQIERRLDGVRKIHCFAMPVDMHVEDARLLKEKMVVQRRDLNAVVEYGGEDWIDLVLRQDDVAHQDFHAAIAFCHGHPTPETEGRRRGLPRQGHMPIVATDRDLHYLGFQL